FYLMHLVPTTISTLSLHDALPISKLEKSPQDDPTAAIMHWTLVFGNVGLGWEDLAFLREHTSLPIILKGILHPDDAKMALEYNRSEEHTSELQSRFALVCRLLLEK